MPTFEIVCLANSRKWQGRCVAGLRTDGEGWVRPVGSNAQGVLHSYHYMLQNNTEAQPLDVLRIDCSRPHPKPHHPEDWVAMPVSWRLVSRPLPAEQAGWLRSHLTAGPELLGCRNDKIAQAALQTRPVSHSLALVAPQGLEWIIKDGKDGKRSTRVAFALDGAEYNLSLTDPVWEQRLKGLPLGTHPRQAARIADKDEIWLTISLGEPFAPVEDGEEFCYKIAAAVITAPCANKSASVTSSARTSGHKRSVENPLSRVRPAPDLSDYPDPFAEEEAESNMTENREGKAAQIAGFRAETPAPTPAVSAPDTPSPAFAADLSAPAYNEQSVPSSPNALPEDVTVLNADRQTKPFATHLGSTAAYAETAPAAPSKASWREKIAKMRQTVPRAYMPWSRDEDALLRRLLLDGETAENIAAQMQRHVGSVRVRMEKLEMAEGMGANNPSVSVNGGEKTPLNASQDAFALKGGSVNATQSPASRQKTKAASLTNEQVRNEQAAEEPTVKRAGAAREKSAEASGREVALEPQVIRLNAQAANPSPQGGAADSVLRVAVCGAAGRMGREVVRAVVEAEGLHLVAAIDVYSLGTDAGELGGVGKTGVPIESQLEPALKRAKPDVLVDFTLPDSVKRHAIAALEHGVSPVIGTTGLSASDLSTLDALAKEQGIGAFIAPNFAIGAVLAMQFAAQAARYLPDVEIIELHHEKKLDSPSGTALLTAQKIAQARQEAGQTPTPLPANTVEKAPGARGARHANTGDIPVHSVRLPGFVAHQEVIFGGQGEILTIRHDSINRASFMPGVILAVRKVRSLQGLVIGLEHLLT